MRKQAAIAAWTVTARSPRLIIVRAETARKVAIVASRIPAPAKAAHVPVAPQRTPNRTCMPRGSTSRCCSRPTVASRVNAPLQLRSAGASRAKLIVSAAQKPSANARLASAKSARIPQWEPTRSHQLAVPVVHANPVADAAPAELNASAKAAPAAVALLEKQCTWFSSAKRVTLVARQAELVPMTTMLASARVEPPSKKHCPKRLCSTSNAITS